MDFSTVYPVVIVLTIAVGITFIIAAIQESKHGQKTADVVRRIYLYLVSFVTVLGIVIGLVGILNIGFRSWVFRNSTFLDGRSAPPTPYLISSKAPLGEIPSTEPLLTCTNGCTLTQEQKDGIAQWESQYRQWKRSIDEHAHRTAQLIMALSFLIISLAVFVPHWMLASRDRHASVGITPLRVTYLWAISFIMLLTSVVAAGFLLNTTLKSAFLKNTSEPTVRAVPEGIFQQQAKDVDSIAACGAACGVDAVIVQHAQEWRQTYDRFIKVTPEEQESRTRHNTFALTLAALIAALPLFAYHFRTVWKETREPTPTKLA